MKLLAALQTHLEILFFCLSYYNRDYVISLGYLEILRQERLSDTDPIQWSITQKKVEDLVFSHLYSSSL